MLGVACRLHDESTADDLGIVHAPPPVEPGDLMATADETFRVVSVVTNPPGSTVGALVMVRPARGWSSRLSLGRVPT